MTVMTLIESSLFDTKPQVRKENDDWVINLVHFYFSTKLLHIISESLPLTNP